MASTTIKVSVETRERIRRHGGATHEDTIVAALDALEAQEFWVQAERAAEWRDQHPAEAQAVAAEAAGWDAAIGSLE